LVVVCLASACGCGAGNKPVTTTTTRHTHAVSGALGHLQVTPSKLVGTKRDTTTGAAKDRGSSITVTIKSAGNGRFRVVAVDVNGDQSEGKTVVVSSRGLEMVAADFKKENDCVWDKPVVLVPAGSAAAGSSRCTFDSDGETQSVKLDWSVRRLADGTRQSADRVHHVARVESTLKLRVGTLLSGTADSSDSYDIATGHVLDSTEESQFTDPDTGKTQHTRTEFHTT
jgi:hypothetical protein